jgi:hypothetical protein
LPISRVEKPCEIGIATSRRIAWLRSESRVQLISFGSVGVEPDEPRPFPFVDTAVLELPPRAAVSLPLPVDDAEPERRAGEATEAGSAGFEPLGERPALREEVLDEVLPVVEGELEPATADDRADELLGVNDVMKR